MLKDIANGNRNLKSLFQDENKRSSYEERILRFFALRDYKSVKGTYTSTMNNFMSIHQNDSEVSIRKLKDQYNGLIETIKTVMGDDAFRSFDERTQRHNRKFNGSVYDSIIIPFSLFDKKSLIQHSNEIRTRINEVKRENKDYQDYTYAGTNAEHRVRGRIEIILNVLNEVVGNGQQRAKKRLFDPKLKEKLFYEGCVCSVCGNRILAIEDCEIDHIIPYDCGGTTSIENAQLLHHYCNKSKGNKNMFEIVDDSEDN